MIISTVLPLSPHACAPLQSSTLHHARCPSYLVDLSIAVSRSLSMSLPLSIYIYTYIYTCKERRGHPRYKHHVPHWWHHRRYCHGCRYKHHRGTLHARPTNITLAPSSPLSSAQSVSLRCFRGQYAAPSQICSTIATMLTFPLVSTAPH